MKKISFNHRLLSINWDEIKNCDDPNEAYKQFFNIFSSIYDIYFPKVFIRLKTKHIQSPWITKEIAKSSKRKQKLYEKFLKHRTRETELTYKSYKNLFESLKKKVKKKYYTEKISKYKHDAKKTWSIMKELIGKIKPKHQTFQEELLSTKLIFLMSVKLQMNLTHSLQTSGVNWQVKFQMLQKHLKLT